MRRFVFMCLVLVACQPTSPSVYEALEAWPSEPETALTVNGRDVPASEFIAFWQAHPEMTRQQVVDALVAREALVGEALGMRRGGAKSYDVARKRGLVNAMLRDEIETIEAPVPDDLDAYRRILSKPKGYRVTNLVLMPPEGGDASKPALAELAQVIKDGLPAEPTALDFVEARTRNYGVVRAHTDLHLVFPDEGVATPTGWTPVVPEFSKAVKAGVEAGQKVIGPFYTKFGAHLVLVEETITGETPTDDDVRSLAHRVASTRKQREALLAMMTTEMKARDWTVYPDAFDKEKE